MHEISLVESLVALVEGTSRREHFSRVRGVCLHVGALGHVEPEALRFCFDAVTLGTIVEGALLTIVTIPATGTCATCEFAPCPLCGAGTVRMIAGDELRLAELEVE
jgi:hydrogenase nickel incorporation protein HypA/HybF